MTKKDYIKIADAIKGAEYKTYCDDKEYHPNGLLDKVLLLAELCEILKSDNPRFDIDKFKAACK